MLVSIVLGMIAENSPTMDLYYSHFVSFQDTWEQQVHPTKTR